MEIWIKFQKPSPTEVLVKLLEQIRFLSATVIVIAIGVTDSIELSLQSIMLTAKLKPWHSGFLLGDGMVLSASLEP